MRFSFDLDVCIKLNISSSPSRGILAQTPGAMDEYIRRTVHTSLTLSMYTSEGLGISTRQIYKNLFYNICCDMDKNPAIFIETARKRFFLDISEILSFVDFFIEFTSSHITNPTLVQERAMALESNDVSTLEYYETSMINYKNSS